MVILHREDTKNLNIPLFVESFPEKFIDASVFSRIREESFLVPDGLRMPIEIPKSYTASDDEAEHKLYDSNNLQTNFANSHKLELIETQFVSLLFAVGTSVKILA